MICLSPNFIKSIEALNDLPTILCNSVERLFAFSFSLMTLCSVARGSMLYSAVTQPLPFPFKKDGTFSSTVAVQITFVPPQEIKQEPSAYLLILAFILISLNSFIFLPDDLNIFFLLI